MVAAIASTIVYVVGTILYGVLTALVLRRRHRTRSEVILLLLSLSAAVWYFGNALDRSAHLLFEGPLPHVVKLTDVICCLGIALVPSLLMVMALFYFHERRRRLPGRLLAVLVGVICLLVLPFSVVLFNVISGKGQLADIGASAGGQVFLGWLALSLVSSAWVCFRQRRRVTDDREERLFQVLFWATTAVGAAIVVSPVLIARGFRAEVDPLISLSALVPGVVFAYYVYRYNYLEFILRHSIVYGFLTLMVISVYYFLIRQFARRLGQRWPRLNVALVEALLVIGLVYLFPRVGQALRWLLRRSVFRRTADTEQRLSDLNRRISLDPVLDLDALLEDVCREVKRACGARVATIVLQTGAGMRPFGDRPEGAFGDADGAAVLEVCSDHTPAWLERSEIGDVKCLAAMRKLRAHSVYPIVHEGAYRGFIAVGGTPRILPLTEDASEQLVAMAGRISEAAARSAMIQEKLQWQRRLYAREKLTSLGRLAASVAHEVRNPLSSIKSLVQCLEEDLTQKGIPAEETGLIVDEINRLSRTVSGLLRYAGPPDQGGLETDFADALDTVAQVLRHELSRRGVTLQKDVPDGLPAVGAEVDAVKEVLFNLLLNALEAMPEGGRLSVSGRQLNGRLHVAVSDTGRGVPEELLGRIFEPSFTTKAGGTGLGLSIVRERLLQIGGAIRCSSGSGGTTMELELPLAGPGP